MGTVSAGNSNLYSKLGDVSKLVSEKSFEPISTGEFNKINENIFSTNSSIDGTYVNGQARLAETDSVAILTKEQETKEKQDKEADALNELVEFTAQMREEAEHRRELQELDAMEWTGDKNEIWDFGDGVTGTREELYNKGKTAWEKSRKEADRRGLTGKEKDDLNTNYQKYLDAIKRRDFDDAAQHKAQLPDWAQAQLEDNKKFQNSLTNQQFDARKAMSVNVSTDAGNDLIAGIQNDVVAGGAMNASVSAKTDFNAVAPYKTAPIQIAKIDVKPQAEVKQNFNYDMGFG